jgi:hypothetical protein
VRRVLANEGINVMSEKISAMDKNTNDLDQADDEILTSEVSDEQLEAAATGFAGKMDSFDSRSSSPACCNW